FKVRKKRAREVLANSIHSLLCRQLTVWFRDRSFCPHITGFYVVKPRAPDRQLEVNNLDAALQLHIAIVFLRPIQNRHAGMPRGVVPDYKDPLFTLFM